MGASRRGGSIKNDVREALTSNMAMSTLFFTASDTSENGQIDREEFRVAVSGLVGGVPDQICDELFDEFDLDGSGEISVVEYISYALRDALRRNASTATHFIKRWDVDGSGEIEKWEFRRAVVAMGLVVPDVMLIDQVFDVMDVNRSGTLSLEEIGFQLRQPHSHSPRGLRPKQRPPKKLEEGGEVKSSPRGRDLTLPQLRGAHRSLSPEPRHSARQSPRSISPGIRGSPRSASPMWPEPRLRPEGRASLLEARASLLEGRDSPTSGNVSPSPLRRPPPMLKSPRRNSFSTASSAASTPRENDTQSLPTLRPPGVRPPAQSLPMLRPPAQRLPTLNGSTGASPRLSLPNRILPVGASLDQFRAMAPQHVS